MPAKLSAIRLAVMKRKSTHSKRKSKPPSKPPSKPAVSLDTFRDDPLYPRIARAAAQILARGKFVAPVDVLVRMNLLTREHLEDWRRGRVPYLERVINCNLTRLSRLLRILRFHAHDLRLEPSMPVYMKWGKGPKHRLRFTKTGDPGLEEAYSRHFLWHGKAPFHPLATRELARPDNPETTEDQQGQ